MLIAPSTEGGLPFLMPARFEQFYRARLRRVVGSRVGSTVLLREYVAWAAVTGLPSLSFKELRRSLEAVGHARRKSDGICYLDLALVDDAPGVPDNLEQHASANRPLTRSDGSELALVAKVDALLAAALDLRSALVAADQARRPHEAAQRILGLFDQ